MWNYARNRKSAVERHFSFLARELVPLAEYCLGMPVLHRFIPAGALPVTTAQGLVLPEHCLLAEPAQAVARGTMLILNDLFAAGFCLRRIGPDTFVVDCKSGRPMLSPTGSKDIVNFLQLRTPHLQVDANISSLADLLEHCIFMNNGVSTTEVEEAAFGLFPLMRSGGNENWYCICHHSCLIPLDNRRELYIRLYDQLIQVVGRQCPTDLSDILQELVFPLNWHELVAEDKNSLLFLFYCGSIYDSTELSKPAQALLLTRFMRNSSAHALQAAGAMISHVDIALMHQSLAPLLIASLQRALDQRGWLVSTRIHTLFGCE